MVADKNEEGSETCASQNATVYCKVQPFDRLSAVLYIYRSTIAESLGCSEMLVVVARRFSVASHHVRRQDER